MIGKINIAFGFLYLVTTASLGPVMVNMYQDYGAAVAEKQTTVGRLQSLKENSYEEDLEPLSAEQIAKADADGILSMNKIFNIESSIDSIKGGPHAHGNLESLLNIAVGLTLGFITAAVWLKYLASALFIIGALMHSGMLYLGTVFGLGWANTLLETGIGPACILLGLFLMGLLTIVGYQPPRDE